MEGSGGVILQTRKDQPMSAAVQSQRSGLSPGRFPVGRMFELRPRRCCESYLGINWRRGVLRKSRNGLKNIYTKNLLVLAFVRFLTLKSGVF